jgi:hypothetical protein
MKFDLCIQIPQVNRKVEVLHLAAQGGFQSVINIGGPIQVQDVAAIFNRPAFLIALTDIGRHEKGKALNVVPVRVSEKDMHDTLSLPEIPFDQIEAQKSDSGAGVNDYQIIVTGADFNAGRVAAEVNGFLPGNRD